MKYDESYNLSGLLIERPKGQVDRSEIVRCQGVNFSEEIPNSRWEEFVFTSQMPLRGEDIRLTPGPFKYPMICRRSGSRLLIMSLSRKIVEYTLLKNLSPVFFPKAHHVAIGVDRLVKAIIKRPTDFALSFVHARLPAFGASLRSVSFYGDDLGDASIFRENIYYMNCFTCGLRRASGGPEIVRLGTDGAISFYLTSSERVLEVEEVLSFLRNKGYLSTQIWNE